MYYLILYLLGSAGMASLMLLLHTDKSNGPIMEAERVDIIMMSLSPPGVLIGYLFLSVGVPMLLMAGALFGIALGLNKVIKIMGDRI